LCLLALVATAAIIKVVWFTETKKVKEKHEHIEVPKAIYILRSRPVFHFEGCAHIRSKRPDVFKMCDDCCEKLMKKS